MNAPFDLSKLSEPAEQFQVAPFLIELNGAVRVNRMADGNRELLVIHPSGVIAARLTLDPINAASIARELSPPAETNGNGG